MEHYELAPNLKICRILNGMWQVAGGHGPIESRVAIEEMVKYHNAGFTTSMDPQRILLGLSDTDYHNRSNKTFRH
jgi:hypothetical protein